MFLTQEFEDKFRYGRYVLHVDMTFDNILSFSSMLEDDSFLEAEKVVVGLEMLLYDYEKIEDIPHEDKFELFKYIMKEYLGNDLDAKQEQAENEEENEEE
ncbi:Bacteriophage Gp15 protein, partial [Virgibacillus subterraneus]